MKTFILFLTLMSLSAVAYDYELREGESLKFKVSGCESDKQPALHLKGSKLTGRCLKAKCQMVYDKQRKKNWYNVYRYKKGQCQWNGCQNALKVGEIKMKKKSLFTSPKTAALEAMKEYLRKSDKCYNMSKYEGKPWGWIKVSKDDL